MSKETSHVVIALLLVIILGMATKSSAQTTNKADSLKYTTVNYDLWTMDDWNMEYSYWSVTNALEQHQVHAEPLAIADWHHGWTVELSNGMYAVVHDVAVHEMDYQHLELMNKESYLNYIESE